MVNMRLRTAGIQLRYCQNIYIFIEFFNSSFKMRIGI